MAFQRRPKRQSKALDDSFRLLGVRDRSENEIRSRLKRKQHTAEAIDETVEKLTRLKLVDDERFARLFVASKLKKHWGPLKLRMKMSELGLNPKIIEESLKEVDWMAALTTARESLAGKFESDRLKLKLLRLGFLHSQINGDTKDD
jgi:regulatory protein